jgi:hypothetical protein
MPDDAHSSPTPTEPSAGDTTDRVADLQRRAYGAGGTEAERAAAAAELGRLRSTGHRGDAAAAGPPAASPTAQANDPEAGAAGLVEASALAESRAHRRLVGVGAAAALLGLLVGGLGGWQLAVQAQQAAAAAAPKPGTVAALTDGDVASSQGMPVDSTGAYRSLVLEDGATALPAMWTGDHNIDPDTVHLLRSASGGIEVFGMMTRDHEDVCLLVMYTDGGAMSCTEAGLFPLLGLTLSASPSYRTDGARAPSLEATWLANGTLSLMTPYE